MGAMGSLWVSMGAIPEISENLRTKLLVISDQLP